MEKTLDILLGEFTGKTLLLILELGSGELVIVVKSGVIEELFVENGFEKELEIAHETSVVTILVLGEDGHKAVVFFVFNILGCGRLRESKGTLDSSNEGHGPKSTSNTHL